MILALQLLAAASGLVISATCVALLNDQPRRSHAGTVSGWLRHHVRRLGLVLMGAGGAMALLSVATGQAVSLDVTVLLIAIAMRQIAHPAGWLNFVRRGQAPHQVQS